MRKRKKPGMYSNLKLVVGLLRNKRQDTSQNDMRLDLSVPCQPTHQVQLELWSVVQSAPLSGLWWARPSALSWADRKACNHRTDRKHHCHSPSLRLLDCRRCKRHRKPRCLYKEHFLVAIHE